MHSPYSSYKGRCVGTILHYIYHYCGLRMAESCTVDIQYKLIEYGNEPIAVYVWDVDEDEVNVPTFRFFGENTILYSKAQNEMRRDVVKGRK